MLLTTIQDSMLKFKVSRKSLHCKSVFVLLIYQISHFDLLFIFMHTAPQQDVFWGSLFPFYVGSAKHFMLTKTFQMWRFKEMLLNYSNQYFCIFHLKVSRILRLIDSSFLHFEDTKIYTLSSVFCKKEIWWN